eukprot:2718821-Pyramimonas_sp.AAC.1
MQPAACCVYSSLMCATRMLPADVTACRYAFWRWTAAACAASPPSPCCRSCAPCAGVTRRTSSTSSPAPARAGSSPSPAG